MSIQIIILLSTLVAFTILGVGMSITIKKHEARSKVKAKRVK